MVFKVLRNLISSSRAAAAPLQPPLKGVPATLRAQRWILGSNDKSIYRSATDVKGSLMSVSAAPKIYLGPMSITLLVLIDNK